jgi:hypothetical protein
LINRARGLDLVELVVRNNAACVQVASSPSEILVSADIRLALQASVGQASLKVVGRLPSGDYGKTGLGTGVTSRNITSGVMERAVFRQANRAVALVEKTFPDGLPGRLDSFHVPHGEASTETATAVVKAARVNKSGKILSVAADSASCR